MAKKKNRKKEYLLKLKRAGIIKTAATSTVKAAANVVSKATLSLEEFSAISAVEGIRPKFVETLYNEGIKSVISKITQKKKFWPLKELVQQQLTNLKKMAWLSKLNPFALANQIC